MKQPKVDQQNVGELSRWLESKAHSLVLDHVRQRIAAQFLSAPVGDSETLVTLRQLAQVVELYEESLLSIVQLDHLGQLTQGY